MLRVRQYGCEIPERDQTEPQSPARFFLVLTISHPLERGQIRDSGKEPERGYFKKYDLSAGAGRDAGALYFLLPLF